jgi:dipeptidyl aminopeptidase/acylaminoacyl peptidase
MVGLAKEQVAASSSANEGSVDASLAAIVAYFPPVDFRQSESEAAGIVNEVSMEELYSRFPALSFEEDLIPSVSPIMFIDQSDPPTLLIHGDADPLVHVSNSVVMNKELIDNNVETDLIIIPGGKHGFGGDNSVRANQARLEWFKTHLLN